MTIDDIKLQLSKINKYRRLGKKIIKMNMLLILNFKKEKVNYTFKHIYMYINILIFLKS